ncbi:hypothetical protein VFA_003108 [Vibrio furnissii CIP 102972]|nr:hypothetical protein VFA_003108 [Vibrio furnissii CIP 102972]
MGLGCLVSARPPFFPKKKLFQKISNPKEKAAEHVMPAALLCL